jgi:hypothetical protein
MRLAWLGLVALLGLPAPANAEPLHGITSLEVVGCVSFEADVRRWTPAEGPLASYVADAYLHRQGALFVAIGYDAKGFWSAESDSGNDGFNDASSLWLRHTTFAGERKSYKLHQANDEPEEARAALRAPIKQKIFAVAKGPLDLTALRHDYRMRMPAHDDDGFIKPFSGWFAEVQHKDGSLLRFGQVARSYMCFCDDHWRGYALAAPKKK